MTAAVVTDKKDNSSMMNSTGLEESSLVMEISS